MSLDAMVVGAGPAGCAVASTLLRAGWEVGLIDRRRPAPLRRVGEGAPPGTEQTVAKVFGAGAFDPDCHRPAYGNRSAWGSDDLVPTDFMRNPFGRGWHLDRAAFDARLLDVVRDQGGFVCTGPEWPRARYVCDATGRAAVVARRLGARLVTDDRLVAAVAVFTDPTHADRDHTTTVEAEEAGWWYTTPVPGDQRVVAYLTDGDLLGPRAERSAAGFCARLAATRHVAALVEDHGYRLAAAPALVAARTTWLDTPAGPSWVAVGDAAAAFDPLSSQGIISALVMGREAGLALAEDSLDRYATMHRRLVTQYLAERAATYESETRWPDSPFWSRRRQRAA